MHNEIHFFLDEIGEFDSTRDEMLIGGVLLFGPYNQQNLFRGLLNCFDQPSGLERIWVYLGHLACDDPAGGRVLWDEAAERLLQIAGTEIDGLAKPFVLALYAKAALVFGDLEEIRNMADRLDRDMEKYPNDILKLHPFGLLMQTTAELCAEIWWKTGSIKHRDQALRWFAASETSLVAGSRLLKLLAAACRLRCAAFRFEIAPKNATWEKELQNKAAKFAIDWSRYVSGSESLNQDSGESMQDYAKRLLQVVRFNYW